jgi:hypothetical protein
MTYRRPQKPPAPPKFCDCGWFLASVMPGHDARHRAWQRNEAFIAAGVKLRRGRPRKTP